MDVTELLAPGPGITTPAAILMGVAALGLIAAAASILRYFLRSGGLINQIFIGASIALLFVSGITAVVIVEDANPSGSAEFESQLFENYGFTTKNAGSKWNKLKGLDDGAGFITAVQREGTGLTVSLRIEDNRLVIIGQDGQEVLTYAQRAANSEDGTLSITDAEEIPVNP